MQKFITDNRGFMILFSFFTVFYLWGITLVPFHPDEVHLLFQSQDYESLLNEPFSLVWQKGTQPDYYRSTVAPLPKYLLGFGRSLAGFPAAEVSTDWDWSASWDANIESGAMPSKRLLTSARAAATMATLAGIFFLYLSARQLQGNYYGLIAAFLLGSNALVLLHGRRAMAEGFVIFGICLGIWGILQADKRPWLTGLGIAIAINSKHSTLALIPIGFISVIWSHTVTNLTNKYRFRNLLKYSVVLIGVSFLLNPFIWKHPVEGVQTMIAERQSWIEDQIETLNEFGYQDIALLATSERIVSILGNIFLVPLSYWEVGNYSQDTLQSEINYQNVFGHNFQQGFIAGGVVFTLTLFGLVIAALDLVRKGLRENRGFLLVIMAAGAQFAALGITVILNYQRFIIPLLPFTSLLAAFGINKLITSFQKNKRSPK